MITKLLLKEDSRTKELYDLQMASYQIEAALIKFDDLPPLRESYTEFRNSGEQFIVYLEDEQLAGALSYTVEDELATICRLVVHPKHFRKGIAQKLLHYFENSLEDIDEVIVSTGKENTPASTLYLKNNFYWVDDKEVSPNVYISRFYKNLNSFVIK